MKASIEVSDRDEAELLREGLSDPTVRAFVLIVASLKRLPTDRSRARMLSYFYDRVTDPEAEWARPPSPPSPG